MPRTLLVGSTRNLLVQGTSTLFVGLSPVRASTGRVAVGDLTTHQSFQTSKGRVIFGGATVSYRLEKSLGRVQLGGTTNIQFNRRSTGASVLQCCVSQSASSGRVTLGSATWDASPLKKAPALTRYYPLWLDDRELFDARASRTPAAAIAILHGIGRDIAHQIDAAGVAVIASSDDGRMCETAEQFRTARYYEVSITEQMDPQPGGRRTLPPADPPVLQWEWSRGFTVTMLYKYRRIRLEQTLFSLSPAIRFGVTWLGELTIEVRLENNATLSAWSTQRLSETEYAHLALTYDPARRVLAVHLNGARVINLVLPREIAAVDNCYIGQWNGGSFMNGEAQDVRIYDSVLRTEFISAETESYCADWIEVLL